MYNIFEDNMNDEVYSQWKRASIGAHLSSEVMRSSDKEFKKDMKGKADMRLLADFYPALVEVAAIMSFGCDKYEEASWKQVPDEAYESAAMRHILKAVSGDCDDNDDEHGHSHWAAVASNALIILTNKINRKKGETCE